MRFVLFVFLAFVVKIMLTSLHFQHKSQTCLVRAWSGKQIFGLGSSLLHTSFQHFCAVESIIQAKTPKIHACFLPFTQTWDGCSSLPTSNNCSLFLRTHVHKSRKYNVQVVKVNLIGKVSQLTTMCNNIRAQILIVTKAINQQVHAELVPKLFPVTKLGGLRSTRWVQPSLPDKRQTDKILSSYVFRWS